MPEKKPIEVWKKKLEALQVAEASASFAGEKFDLSEKINEAKERIAEFEHQAAVAQSPATSGRLHTTIPNNLPRVQPFFGRENELAEIARALDPASRTWGTLVDGDVGMGKTSLAVCAAYNCPTDCFDRIVFVSLKQQEQDDHRRRKLDGFVLSSWMEMLNEIGRLLELPDIAKATENERARLLRDMLKGRCVLLVLDNLETLQADEQDQLFTFLEYLPGDCKAILTSHDFAGNRLLAIDLPKLDQPSALRLLAEIAQRNFKFANSTEAARIDLCDKTSGNPLLLRWVAGQVGHGSCTNIADALDYLSSCPPGNDPLAFIFDDLLRSFGPAEIRILAALTFPVQPIPVEAIADISEVAVDDTRRLLKILANRSLVVPDQKDTSFALVPMVVKFLRHKKHEAVQQIGARLADRAAWIIMENGWQKYDRFHVLDLEWPTLSPALLIFLGGSDERLQGVCAALGRYLNSKGLWDELLSLYKEAEQHARIARNFKEAGWRSYQIGYIHFQRKQVSELQSCVDKVAHHYWSQQDTQIREKAAAIRLQGLLHRLKQEYPEAVAAFYQALEMDRLVKPESRDVWKDLSNLAKAEEGIEDHTAADKHRREAHRVAQAVDAAQSVAILASNQAGVTLKRKDWAGAEQSARQALHLSEKIRTVDLIAINCRRLAEALLRQGKTIEALPHAQRAVAIYTYLGSPRLKHARETLCECEG